MSRCRVGSCNPSEMKRYKPSRRANSRTNSSVPVDGGGGRSAFGRTLWQLSCTVIDAQELCASPISTACTKAHFIACCRASGECTRGMELGGVA